MIIRQLKEKQYEDLYQYLITKAWQAPLDASFDVGMTVNQTEYILKILPASRRRMVALQAVEVERDPKWGLSYVSTTNNKLLSSLLELLLREPHA